MISQAQKQASQSHLNRIATLQRDFVGKKISLDVFTKEDKMTHEDMKALVQKLMKA
jgi:hypothetical protein